MAYASWHTTVTDLQGNVIPNASIYVVNEVTGIAPQLYADRQGLVPLGNPFTAEADGTVSLYVVGGAYRIRASFGAWERTWRYVGIGTAQEYDAEAIIGDALDNTVQVIPQSFTPEQQEQARENIGAASRYDAVISRAGIEHFRTGGFIYDVVTVRSPKLHTVRKEFAPGVAPDGVVTRVPARQMAAENGYSVVINADGWRNADGTPGTDKPQGRPMGLQIANGTLYQDWTPEEHRTQAIVMMSDGKLVEANKGDGISGAQWVANGAQWSISWGMVCVRNGVPVDLTGGYVADVVSARTVIGQKPNGDIVVVMVEGISESYGATPTQCGPLMASLGCEIAYICDGGGSTQGWWENTYAVPSSDRTDVHYPMERGVVSFIVIEPDVPVQQYDSGFISLGPLNAGFSAMGGGNLPGAAPAIAIRHLGAEIKMMLRVQGTFPANADANVAPDGTVPYRYLYSINGPTRVFGTANGYVPAVVAIPPAGSVIAKVADTSARTQAIGYGGWPAMFSGLPTKSSTP